MTDECEEKEIKPPLCCNCGHTTLDHDWWGHGECTECECTQFFKNAEYMIKNAQYMIKNAQYISDEFMSGKKVVDVIFPRPLEAEISFSDGSKSKVNGKLAVDLKKKFS